MSNRKAKHNSLMCEDCLRTLRRQFREIEENLEASGMTGLPGVLIFQLADVVAGYPLPVRFKSDRMVLTEQEGYRLADFIRQLCGVDEEVQS